MMHSLLKAASTRLSAGLDRAAVQTASRWACKYRVMGGKTFPGPWSFKHHPWLRQMHDDLGEVVVGRKAAQMGYTEWALNKTFFVIDIQKGSVLYILPASTPDASDFSTSRFDPALEMSPHLASLFSDVANIGHKRAGGANLFIRGSRSRSQMKSLPVDLIVADEVAEMNQANLKLAFERVSGQRSSQIILISTPTFDGMGIDEYYAESTQSVYMFRCPSCAKHTTLTFPECLVITADDPWDIKLRDSFYRCQECHAPLPHERKAEWLKDAQWVDAYPDRTIKGYHISQLYSATRRPDQIAALYLKSVTDLAAEQEFFNSKLGVPHVVEGARVTDQEILTCMGSYQKARSLPPGEGFVTIGIDVGKKLHYEVTRYFFDAAGVDTRDINSRAEAQLVAEGDVPEFEDLDALISAYHPKSVVIDAQPERRKALEFANRFYGLVKLCFYGTIKGKGIRSTKDDSEHTVTVDRVTWLDTALGRIHNQTIDLPMDLSGDYKSHVKALVRRYLTDRDGNQVGTYEKKENDHDHLAHARTYSEIALTIGVATMKSENINDLW